MRGFLAAPVDLCFLDPHCLADLEASGTSRNLRGDHRVALGDQPGGFLGLGEIDQRFLAQRIGEALVCGIAFGPFEHHRDGAAQAGVDPSVVGDRVLHKAEDGEFVAHMSSASRFAITISATS